MTIYFRGKHNFPFSILRTCVHTGTGSNIINYHYFISGTILSGYVALLTLYCHQDKEELLT
jgi:hypothetical protein